MAGYIGIDRGIVNHWIYKDPEYFKTWFEILYRARYSKETGTELIEGQLVEVNYGEFIFGRIKWSDRIGISERRLRTLMDKLIADEMITLIKRAPKFSIYSVNNYAKYRQQNDQQEDLEPQGFDSDGDQQNVQQTTSKRPANDQQVTTKEKGSNKVNKVKKETNKTYTPEFDEFWNVYPRKLGKVEAFKTWTKVIKNGESPELIIKCASNYAIDCQNKQTDQQYIKHPRTFLNDERYKDYTLIAVGGGNSGKYTGVSEGIRHGGAKKESEYAFLDVSSPRTGTTPYDPTIF